MHKKYIVRLTEEERRQCASVVDKLKGTSQKVKRANILLKADSDGPAWTDQQIADAFRCRRQTVENARKKFVLEGFQQALEHKNPKISRPKALDGKQEAQIIAMRLGEPPKGYGKWTLRLLARKAVELEIVASISHETVRIALKKTA
jgi:transposase